jgi:hypothetical protein
MPQTVVTLSMILALARRVAHRAADIEVIDALGDYVREVGRKALSPECLAASGRGNALAANVRRAADMASITGESRADQAIMEVIGQMWRVAREAENLAPTVVSEVPIAA